MRGRRLLRDEHDGMRLGAFVAGLLVIFIATESPLDAFDGLLLSAHMCQHLLLLMIAPPLVLLGHPTLPLLRGLPKAFVKEGLGPFLSWPALRRCLRWLTSPPVAWIIFAVSTISWHLPAFYEMAIHSPTWHGIQHACFFWTGILFWWPVVLPSHTRSRWPRWIIIPYLLFADILNTVLSALFVFSGHVLYPTYENIRLGGVAARDDQTLAGLIMWVPGSLVYLVPAILISVHLFIGGAASWRRAGAIKLVRKARIQNKPRFQLAKWRRAMQVAMLLIAIGVVADGFVGPQVTPLNAAGVLPWIHWRALSIMALLVVGNLFCMACPFMLVRDIGRSVLPAKLRWPRALRSKWLAAGLFVLYLWAYEAFNLWDSAWLTACIISGYFVVSCVIDGLFRGASFCKYVCPIGQFHFITSLISPREVRVRRSEVCKSCQTHDCIRGNEHARGCELYLFQPKKVGNLDCTFCLECVNACPQANVVLAPTAPASTLLDDPYRSSVGKLSKRTDLAVMAAVVVFGGFVNAAGMISPVMQWEHHWHARLGSHSMPLIVGILLITSVVLLPAAAIFIGSALNRLATGRYQIKMARRFVFSLVPIGVAMWAAHLLYHFATGWNAVGPILERAFSASVTALLMPVVPDWLSSAQLVVLDCGLLLTLYVCWRVSCEYGQKLRTGLELAAPWMAISIGLYAAGVWILFQPMQMRGMAP